jgi:hypothetical protein
MNCTHKKIDEYQSQTCYCCSRESPRLVDEREVIMLTATISRKNNSSRRRGERVSNEKFLVEEEGRRQTIAA